MLCIICGPFSPYCLNLCQLCILARLIVFNCDFRDLIKPMGCAPVLRQPCQRRYAYADVKQSILCIKMAIQLACHAFQLSRFVLLTFRPSGISNALIQKGAKVILNHLLITISSLIFIGNRKSFQHSFQRSAFVRLAFCASLARAFCAARPE